MPKFDLEKTCRLVQDHQVTFLYVPPPIILLLSKHPVVEKFDLSSIRFVNSGAAPLSRELVVEVWERLKIGVKQGYGLSETSPVSNTQLVDEWWRFQGSVGRLVAGMQAKVVDAEGRELPRGEVCPRPCRLLGLTLTLTLVMSSLASCSSRAPTSSAGTGKSPSLTRRLLPTTAGFAPATSSTPAPRAISTSRTASRSSSNTVRPPFSCHIQTCPVDLAPEGFQVPPAELEDKLLGHKDIADVGVVGVWDPERHTEIPRAYIVPRPGVEPSDALAQGIVAWLAERVAPAKRLRGGVRFVDEIPKSQAGKILRRILRDQAKEEQEKGPRAKL